MPINTSYKFLGLIIPIALFATTWPAFNLFGRYYGSKTAYFLGFTFYCLVWCLLIPLVFMASHAVRSLLQINIVSFHNSKFINLICLLIPLILPYLYAFSKGLKIATFNIFILSLALALIIVPLEELPSTASLNSKFNPQWLFSPQT